jgi:uncharacterized protein
MTPTIPGVYREDLFPKAIPKFLTGVPAFLGFAQKGALNQPERLTLWPQFTSFFGEPFAESYLSDAVQGFFANGGHIGYVVRLDERIDVEAALENALEALATIDTVDLVCVPDLVRYGQAAVLRMQTALLEHCQQLGDRFAILDSLSADISAAEIKEQQQPLSQLAAACNGALYFPWIQVANRMLPPCGHIAGVYAQRDRDIGIFQAPANVRLEEALDLSTAVSDADQALLNPLGVNCLRSLPGRGIRIWGARTLSADPNWRYINVRRLVLTVARWCDRTFADVVFEPNDFRLWVRIERELTSFCEVLFRQGALQGQTAEEAFYVRCDGQTNPPEVREMGKVITEIGLAPASPAEFIVVRLIHGNAGVALTP